MLEKVALIENRYKEINLLLEQVGEDYQRAAELARERAELEEVVNKAHQYRQAEIRLNQARQLLSEGDEPELAELAQADILEIEPLMVTMEADLRSLLVPKDPRDERNVIVEIRAGTGGDEAGLFAADLFRMYARYAERRNWKVEILSQKRNRDRRIQRNHFSASKGKALTPA